MQARYYDPALGRFLSNDPVGFADSGFDPAYFNRYAYTANDPVNLVDPNGQEPFTFDTVPLTDSERAAQLEGSKTGTKVLGGLASLTPIGKGAQGLGLAGKAAVGGALLRRGASKSFSGAGKFVSKTTGQATKTGGRSGRNTSQVFSNGGQKSANKLFDTLTKGGKTKTNPNGSLQGTLKDGSSVNLSTNSKGITSVRIRQSQPDTGTRIRKEIKVRFKEDQ